MHFESISQQVWLKTSSLFISSTAHFAAWYLEEKGSVSEKRKDFVLKMFLRCHDSMQSKNTTIIRKQFSVLLVHTELMLKAWIKLVHVHNHQYFFDLTLVFFVVWVVTLLLHVDLVAVWIEYTKEQPFLFNICGQIVGKLVNITELRRPSMTTTAKGERRICKRRKKGRSML
jgi:hypothetical protein